MDMRIQGKIKSDLYENIKWFCTIFTFSFSVKYFDFMGGFQ